MPALSPILPASRSLGCTSEGEESHFLPTEMSKGFSGVTCGSH